jgi:hypothetical protein
MLSVKNIATIYILEALVTLVVIIVVMNILVS